MRRSGLRMTILAKYGQRADDLLNRDLTAPAKRRQNHGLYLRPLRIGVIYAPSIVEGSPRRSPLETHGPPSTPPS